MGKDTEKNNEQTENVVTENEKETTDSCEPKVEEAENKEPTLEEKLVDCENQIAQLKDQYLRKCADFDNYRKRMIKEKQDAFDYANANLLTDLLSSLDDLDRALAAAADTKGTEGASALVEGVSLIQKQLRTMLENKYNLVGFGEKGDAYDHDKYEAIASNPAAVKEPVCAEIYLKGYMLKNRVLRPAKVMVHMPDGSVTE